MSFPPPDPQPTDPPPFPTQQPYPNAGQAAYYAAPPARSQTLGRVAFIVGLVVLVLSVTASVFIGNVLGGILQPGASFAQGFAAGQNTHDPHAILGGGLAILQILVGTGLGVWAFVQGIVAVRSNRGRGWGIVAIVLASVAPILSFIVYVIVVGVTQAGAS